MSEPIVTELDRRRLVAQRIRSLRDYERQKKSYPMDRGKEDYIEACRGLKYFFDYARTLRNSNLVVDIGAGTTRAISQIAKSELGQGLKFKATVLDKKPQVNLYLGENNTITTSAEMLKGISSESVAGILGIVSIGYCEFPEIAAKRINEVLIPNGVIKSAFGDGIIGTKRMFEFATAWRDMDYDVAIKPGEHAVLIAIKPGGNKTISASELLEKDLKEAPPKITS